MIFELMMAVPEKSLPTRWNNIPGARGCTPQNIGISDYEDNLSKYAATSIGISTQSIEGYQSYLP